MLSKNTSCRNIWRSIGILLVFNLSVFGQQWSWQDFSPVNSGWRVTAPNPLQPDAEAQKTSGKRGSYSYNDFHGFFAVIYQSYSNWDWYRQKDRFNKQRDLVVNSNQGQLIRDIEFTNRGVVGREVMVKFPSGTMTKMEGQTVTKYRIQRFRMFFYGKRLYVILAVLPEDDVNRPEIDNYLNSFYVNTEPKAVSDSFLTDEDIGLKVNISNGVLSNDTDLDKDKLVVSTAHPWSLPTHGILLLNADGSFTYKPNPDFNGKDSFTYQANDGVADSEIATVIITVKPVNDSPIISNVPATLNVNELIPLTFKALGSDIDNPTESIRFSLTDAPEGSVINPQTGVFFWTPSEIQGAGQYLFKVNATDGETTSSAPIKITVDEVNVAPLFSNIPTTTTINELEPYTFTVKATDSDIPIQTLTYSLDGAPDGATINSTTGLFNWTPSEIQGNGSSYEFTVKVSDGIVTTDAGIRLTVKEVNSAPILQPVLNQTIDELKPLSLFAAGSDQDIPANLISYELNSNAPAGMTIDLKSGQIFWIPSEAQGSGDYSVTVRLTDSGTPSLFDTKTFKIHVNEVNTAPRLTPLGNRIVNEELNLTFNVTAADADLPANSLRYSIVVGPAGASLDNGKFTWTPTERQGPGTFNLTIRVTDNGDPVLLDEQTITISVNEVNTAPITNDLDVTTDEDTVISLSLTADDPDLPLNTLNYSIIAAPLNGKLSGTGSNLTYTSNPNFNGRDSFIFKANDGSADSNISTFYLNLRPVNDLPVANPDTETTDADVPVTVRVIVNDTDVDGDKLIVTEVSKTAEGSVVIVDNAIKFTPNPQFYGRASFKYVIKDIHGGTAIGLVTVNVNPVKPD